MMLQVDMSEGFWAEAVSHTSYLVNMSPFISIDFQIPEEIWRGESVDYLTLQIFDCPTYNLVDSQKRNKLESKSKRCYFIGFTKGTKVYRLYDQEKKSALLAEMWSLMKIQCCKQC